MSEIMTNIWTHHDPDGYVAAYFLRYLYPNAKIKVTKEFGETKDWAEGDFMTDMRPNNPKIKGTVYDHHPGHPPLSGRAYKLIWQSEPASYIVWNKFKDKIPKSEWWKLAIGVTGDGQPELIPYEVFETNHELLLEPSTYIGQSYGKWRISKFPVYRALSSPINAFARFGEHDTAFNLIKDAKNPLDIINDPKVRKQKGKVKAQFDDAINNCELNSFDYLDVVFYTSYKCRLSGYIASALQGGLKNRTVMAINTVSGSTSMRGDLALYYRDRLQKSKFVKKLDIDGHAKFMGGKLNETTDELLEQLVKEFK